MSEHYVDLVIRARDEASKKIGLFTDNMTAMQQKIANSIGGSTFDAAGVSKIKSQFEELENIRARITEKLSNQKVDQHPDFLNALLPPDFSKQLQQRMEKADSATQNLLNLRNSFQEKINNQNIGKHPDFLNALLPSNFSDQLKQRMEKANNILLSEHERLMTSLRNLVGKGTIAGIAGFAAVKIIDSITNAHKRFNESEKTTRDYINVWAESIPIFGRVSASIRELVTELSGVNEAQARATKSGKLVDTITAMQGKFQLNEKLRNAPNDREREKIRAEDTYNKQLVEIQKQKNVIDQIKRENEAELNKPRTLVQRIFTTPLLQTVPKFDASLNAEALREYRAALAEIDAKPIRDITQSLQEQIDTFGMTAGQIAYYKAEIAGANQQELINIQTLSWKLQALDDEKAKTEAAAAAEKKKDEEEAAAAKRRMDEIDTFTDKVKQMLKTPDQEFAEIQKKLQRLLELKKITQQEFFESRNKFAKDIFGDTTNAGAGRAMSWTPLESQRLTMVPGSTSDPSIRIAVEQKKIAESSLKEQREMNININKVNDSVRNLEPVATVSLEGI